MPTEANSDWFQSFQIDSLTPENCNLNQKLFYPVQGKTGHWLRHPPFAGPPFNWVDCYEGGMSGAGAVFA